MIPDIRRWVYQSRLEAMTFHMAQALTEDRREMEQCIGRLLQPNDVPDIILGPEQELLPDDACRRRRIEAMAEEQRLAFGRMVEAILGRKESAERARQARLA
ncbi:hypothetical protein QTP88_004922 [Uroleucon formosanum]